MMSVNWGRVFADDILLAGLLAAAAGFADAVGYLASGVFAANMTGNTVLAGLSLAQGHWQIAAQRGATLAAFFLGAMIGSLILRVARRHSAAPIALEAALILIAAFVEPSALLAIIIIAGAMGIQATALTRFRQATASTVVITSAMARLAEYCLVLALDRREARAQAPKLAPAVLAATWVCYALGALIAALALDMIARPLFLPAAMLAMVVLLVLLRSGEG
jgi:uncharacterized membrane protein YoaK (UPF0700 family)